MARRWRLVSLRKDVLLKQGMRVDSRRHRGGAQADDTPVLRRDARGVELSETLLELRRAELVALVVDQRERVSAEHVLLPAVGDAPVTGLVQGIGEGPAGHEDDVVVLLGLLGGFDVRPREAGPLREASGQLGHADHRLPDQVDRMRGPDEPVVRISAEGARHQLHAHARFPCAGGVVQDPADRRGRRRHALDALEAHHLMRVGRPGVGAIACLAIELEEGRSELRLVHGLQLLNGLCVSHVTLHQLPDPARNSRAPVAVGQLPS